MQLFHIDTMRAVGTVVSNICGRKSKTRDNCLTYLICFSCRREGYRSSGYRSSKRSFVTRDGITHIFCRDHLGNPSLCPPSWRHDVSVWVMDEDVFSADFLLAAIYDVVGSENVASFELLSTIVVTPRDSTISDRKTLSHCYKLVYQNNAGKAISKQHAWNMMMEVRESLEKRTNRVVIVR